jgi:hypothetical protein
MAEPLPLFVALKTYLLFNKKKQEGIFMKKFLIIMALMLCSAPVLAFSFTMKSIVLLNTDVKTAEQILIDTVNLYNPTLTMLNSIQERHIYNVRYNWGVYMPMPTSAVNINVNATDKMAQNSTYSSEGGFSCSFKEIDKVNTLATCRKISPVNAYIYNHFEKYFQELKVNNIQYISYKKYLKMKAKNQL